MNKKIELITRVGLKANKKKTKYMLIKEEAAPRALTRDIYDNIDRKRWELNSNNLTYAEFRKLDISYKIYGKTMKYTILI